MLNSRRQGLFSCVSFCWRNFATRVTPDNHPPPSENDGIEPTIPWERVVPIFRDGFWNKPKISSRSIAMIRKRTIASGKQWIDPRPEVREKPEYIYNKTFYKLKRHKWERTLQARKDEVKKNLEKMPGWIAAYRKDERARKVKTTTAEKLLWPKDIKNITHKKKRRGHVKISDEDQADRSVNALEKEAGDTHTNF